MKTEIIRLVRLRFTEWLDVNFPLPKTLILERIDSSVGLLTVEVIRMSISLKTSEPVSSKNS